MEEKVIVALLLFLFLFPKLASASNSVVIVNQVRGTECCDTGSVANLSSQLTTTSSLGLPATYAFRYDALLDMQMVSLINEQKKQYPILVNIGGFLEITPALAKSAGVTYTAPERDWYKTTHVYTPGYTQSERINILDTYMSAFHKAFGIYPELTVGWFMDTYSLNYLHEHYGVVVHELTREQWGTDSYTLSGGPVHYPYIASKNWSFLPGSDGIAIIRQTITDPRFNYGDGTSSYTGQPNDYSRNKDFSYFTSLISTVLSQPAGQDGFAVLGLENSMESKYQEEFIHQLEYLATNYGDISYPSPKQIVELSGRDKVSLYGGDDAYWITTSSYQLRLLVADQKVRITDLRLYDQKIGDPYESNRVLNSGYFISPYLIDGSRWFQFKTSWLKAFFSPQFNEGYGARNDSHTLPSHLSFPSIKQGSKIEIIKNSDGYDFRYFSSTNKEISLLFKEDEIETRGLSVSDLSFKNLSGDKVPVKESIEQESYHLTWYNNHDKVMSLDGTCKLDLCTFTPFIDASKFVIARRDQAFLLLPTKVEDQDTSGTLLYPSLKYLVHGRSPARIVVLPSNKQGIPVVLTSQVEFSSTSLTALSDPSYLQGQEAQFYDFSAKQPGKYSIQVTVPGIPPANFDFYFARDCRAQLAFCLKHPQDLYTYMRAIIAGKFRK